MKNQLKRVITALIMASCCILFNYILNTLMTEVITGIMIGYFLIEVMFLTYVWFEQTEIVFEDNKKSLIETYIENDKKLMEYSSSFLPIEADKELDYYNQVPLYYTKNYIVYNLKEEHLKYSTGMIITKEEAQHYIDTSCSNETDDLVCNNLSDSIINSVDKTLDMML